MDTATARPEFITRDAPVLTMRDIGKSFPGVRALDGARLDLRAGEVHVLFGENGAGKSTLINIIAGVIELDEGEMTLLGRNCRFASVQEARAQGIGAMFQEFSLAPHLTVEENLMLGNEIARFGLLNRGAQREKARRILDSYGFRVDPRAVVQELSRAEQQMVEMAKVMLLEPRILILDEPTASLSEAETKKLFATVRELRAKGVAIIYITHRMREIQELADRITIMRDGRHIATIEAGDADQSTLVELMTGRKIGNLYPARSDTIGGEVLRLNNLHTRTGTVRGVDLMLRRGEILGLAGLVGCGKSEIGRAVFGIEPLAQGDIVLDGRPVDHPSPARMLTSGVAYLPSDRRSEGLMPQRPTLENITASALSGAALSRRGVIRRQRERSVGRALAEAIQLRPMNLDAEVANYSGGNQQKIVLARALATRPRILILDEPTVGVDVGARAQIYQSIIDLAREGCGILLISSDMPEIINLCHRAHAVSNGRIVHEMVGAEITEERLLHSFFREAAGQGVEHEPN